MKKAFYLSFVALIIFFKQTQAQSTQILVHNLIAKVEKHGVYENHLYTGYFETKILKRLIVESGGFTITITREQNDALRCVIVKRISDGLTFLDWNADGFLNPVPGWDAYKRSSTSSTTYFLSSQNLAPIEDSYRSCIDTILASL